MNLKRGDQISKGGNPPPQYQAAPLPPVMNEWEIDPEAGLQGEEGYSPIWPEGVGDQEIQKKYQMFDQTNTGKKWKKYNIMYETNTEEIRKKYNIIKG